jgi:hypothetical protein
MHACLLAQCTVAYTGEEETERRSVTVQTTAMVLMLRKKIE